MKTPADELMARYTLDRVLVDADEFRAHIESLPGTVYDDDPRQREFERVFTWGHDHDFGPFKMEGHMGDRHVRLIDRFTGLGVVFGGRVLDVGCWTGGTSLLLAALGCRVTAIEEVGHYAGAAQYLADSFGLDNMTVQPRSLYAGLSDLGDPFDLVLLAGVLYHLSDPIRALRILFEALRDGGTLLIETETCQDERPLFAYIGPRKPGYRWLVPSPPALRYVLEDTGFDVAYLETTGNRSLCIAMRDGWQSMMRAGVAL